METTKTVDAKELPSGAWHAICGEYCAVSRHLDIATGQAFQAAYCGEVISPGQRQVFRDGEATIVDGPCAISTHPDIAVQAFHDWEASTASL